MPELATPFLPPVDTPLRVWLLDYSTEFDWVVAESAEHAKQLCMDEHGWDAEDLDDVRVEALPDDYILPVYIDEPFRFPTPMITLTAAEWCQRQKPGILASTLH